jgi:hypothetical protein
MKMLRRKSHRTPKTTMGRMCSTKFSTLVVSFAAALKGKTEERRQSPARQVSVAAPATVEQKALRPYSVKSAGNRSVNSGSKCKQPTSGQYVESSNCSTANYDRVQWCCIIEG